MDAVTTSSSRFEGVAAEFVGAERCANSEFFASFAVCTASITLGRSVSNSARRAIADALCSFRRLSRSASAERSSDSGAASFWSAERSLWIDSTSLSTALSERETAATSDRSDSSESSGTDPFFTASTSVVIRLMRSRTEERSLWREAIVASVDRAVSRSEETSVWTSPTICWVAERSERRESVELWIVSTPLLIDFKFSFTAFSSFFDSSIKL